MKHLDCISMQTLGMRGKDKHEAPALKGCGQAQGWERLGTAVPDALGHEDSGTHDETAPGRAE